MRRVLLCDLMKWFTIQSIVSHLGRVRSQQADEEKLDFKLFLNLES
jgi:hypothetical protein